MKQWPQNLIQSLLILILLGLAACNRDNQSQSIVASNPDEVAGTLWGADDDHSGVRDDVEAWILKSEYSADEKKALHFLALNYQGLLLNGAAPEDADRLLHDYTRALDCLNYTFGPERARDVRETLKRVQFDTPKRISRFREHTKHFTPDKIKPLESYKSKLDICPFSKD